jgi:two-component system chemotaxis response regulator CheB
MVPRDVIAIGASTGGVAALMRVAAAMPSGFAASLFAVCHLPPGFRSVLPEILSRQGPLLASHPADMETFNPGHIYVAPPDRHLLLEAGRRMRLSRGPRENNHRPAVDPLFRSAARNYGPRVIGVVLTGALSDGAAGLMAVRAAGGVAVVQDPRDALVGSMPLNAAQAAGADHVVPLADLPGLLVRLVKERGISDVEASSMDPIEKLPAVVDRDMDQQIHGERRGAVSVFTCPECGGGLWQVDESAELRFRCHVGHAYSGEVLLAEQNDALEAALWTAVRTYRDKSVLARQLAHRQRARGDLATAERFEERANLADRYGDLIQKYVLEAAPANAEEFPEFPKIE